MFKLLGAFKDGEVRRRKESIARYRAILELGDNASAEDLAELAKLAEMLGKNAEAVESDMRALHGLIFLRNLAAQRDAREKVYREKSRARDAFADESEKIIKERRAVGVGLTDEAHEAEKAFGASRNAERKIFEIEQVHWELLGKDIPDVGPSPMAGPPQE